MQTGLDARIEVLIELYRRRIELLATIPGVSPTTAPVILADITQFPSAGHLASRARICPGHHESAGKHTSRTTRPGDPWLMGVLRLRRAAISAARGKNTYLAARYRRLVIRRGRRRALVALHQLHAETIAN
jgi:transposase